MFLGRLLLEPQRRNIMLYPFCAITSGTDEYPCPLGFFNFICWSTLCESFKPSSLISGLFWFVVLSLILSISRSPFRFCFRLLASQQTCDQRKRTHLNRMHSSRTIPWGHFNYFYSFLFISRVWSPGGTECHQLQHSNEQLREEQLLGNCTLSASIPEVSWRTQWDQLCCSTDSLWERPEMAAGPADFPFHCILAWNHQLINLSTSFHFQVAFRRDSERCQFSHTSQASPDSICSWTASSLTMLWCMILPPPACRLSDVTNNHNLRE